MEVLDRASLKVASGSYGKVTFWKTNAGRCGAKVNVVIKEQTPAGSTERMLAECEVDCMKQLTEMYFPALWGAEERSGKVTVAMEQLRWELQDVIEGKAELDGKTFKYSDSHIGLWIYDLYRGLLKLHSKGIYHRDIKGENVMITNGLHAKLVDFGLACQERSRRSDCKSICDAQAGTAMWMSPEYAGGSLTPGPHLDYWALGLLLGKLLWRDPNWPAYLWNCGTHQCIASRGRQVGQTILDSSSHPMSAKLLRILLHEDPNKRVSRIDEAFMREWALVEMEAPEDKMSTYPDTSRPPADCKANFQ